MPDNATIMRELLNYVRERMTHQNAYPFCAFVVKNGVILAKGYNDTQNTFGDATTHGEMVAIKKVTSAHQNLDGTKGCALYTTCQPCLACYENAYWRGIDTIVYGADHTDFPHYFNPHPFDFDQFSTQNHLITIIPHVLRSECIALFNQAKEKYGW